MSSKEKEGDRATVFRTTKVRTKLKGDASWLQRRDEPQAETEEEKPWLAEVRAGRLNGAPIETSPVTSPTKPPLPPNKPDADRAPTSGFLIRGVFTKLDNKSAPSSTSNGISGTTQFSKKPSESYKRIAPHTVRNTSENREGQLSQEEQDKRTEAASNVLKQSAVRQRSYVLSAAKKYESKEKAPDTISPSFVAKRVEIVDDDDESATAPAPASSPPPTPVIPVTSVASAPQPKPRKIVDTGAKTAVEEPVAPKVKETAPEPVKEDPAPVSVTKKDPFEDMKPGCTKVATPLPEYVPTCVQAVCAEPEPEDSDVSGQAVTPLVPLTPALPTLVSSTSASPAPPPTAPKSPVSPAPAPTALKSPASPAPAETAPKSPAPAPTAPKSPASPAPAETAPKSPAPASPAPAPTAPKSPASPAPAETAPKSPAPASPAPAPTAPKSPASPAPAPTDPESPAPVPPIPLSPVPVSTVTAITVKSEPEPEPEPEPEEDPEPEPECKLSPKPSASVDTLTALYGSLISFDTSSTSFQDDEPALAKEEGGSADSHTAENGVEEEPALNNCEPETEDLLALDDGPEESAEPVPPSPGRWSQDLLGGLDSEAEPAKTSGSLDLLANDVVLINTEPHSLSTQREEEKQTDETAKATQSPTETVTITTKTVIITDKSEEDNADPWSTHVTTTVTESSSADPFDPYPIGTTSPNSSSDLLQPLTDISINRASTTSMENQDPSPEINMSSGALKSLADDVIPINTDTTSLSTKRSWARTWETSTPQQTNTEKSQEPEPEGQAKDQETLIMFERKSNENDSPWDKWTSPTVYTITTTAGEVEEEEEEEEEEESPEDTQTQTVTTFTTIREIQSEPEPAMDRYETYSRTVIEEDRQVQTPEPETKKGIVYVKEYVNATELSLHNARDTCDDFYRGSDNLTSSSMSYSYSSPSTYSSGSLSSTCTYCGEQVGNDAKITIEHLNINCHPACFKCGVCSKPMGDLLYSMFLHGGKVHCESCYSKAFD